MSRCKEKFEQVTLPSRREPYIKISGDGRYGYYVAILDEDVYWRAVADRKFWFGRKRAEAWGKRQLAKYLAKREHEDYVKVIY